MAKYEILFRKSVTKDLRPIPGGDVRRILNAVRSLADNPRLPQSRKLSGDEKYRLRCGVYRVLYLIDDPRRVVFVVKVAHRKDVYRS
jgi:mRNA interferase RelE/StbE